MSDLIWLTKAQMRQIESYFHCRAALAAKGGKPDQLMFDALPGAKVLLGDKGYGAGWFCNGLAVRRITLRISSKTNRKVLIPHDRWHMHSCPLSASPNRYLLD